MKEKAKKKILKMDPVTDEEMFMKISSANEILSDRETRRQYDEQLVEGLIQSFPPLKGMSVGEKLHQGDEMVVDPFILRINDSCQLELVQEVVTQGYFGIDVDYKLEWRSENEPVYWPTSCYATIKKRRDKSSNKSVIKLQLVNAGKVIWQRVATAKAGEVVLTVKHASVMLLWRSNDFPFLFEKPLWCGGGPCGKVKELKDAIRGGVRAKVKDVKNFLKTVRRKVKNSVKTLKLKARGKNG